MNSFPRHLRGPSTTEPTLIAVSLGGGAFLMSLLPLSAQITSVAAVAGGAAAIGAVRRELRIRRRLRALDTTEPAAATPSSSGSQPVEARTVTGAAQ